MLSPAIFAALMLTRGQDSTLPHNTFEKDAEGWTALQAAGTGATLDVTHEAAHLKSGGGSLVLKYKIGTGQIGAAMRPVEVGKLATMQSIHFWAQADHSTGMVIALQEHNGGRYAAMFELPKGKWQEVDLSLADFVLSQEKDAPKDPDNKLDPDQIEGISFLDVQEFLYQSSAFADALGIKAGGHTLYVSDFKISDAKLADAAPKTAGSFQFDTYSRPQVGWVALGVTGSGYAVDSPFPGKWMQLDYSGSATKLSGVSKQLKLGDLTAMKSLSLQFGSTRPVQLLVQLEQVNGAKFNSIIDVPGKAESKQFDIPVSKLTLSDDSPDKNAKMDLAQVKQIVIVDISGLTLGAEQDNTLYIGPVVANY